VDRQTLKTVVGSVLLGLVFFGVVMGISMGLVMYNASATPQFAWFPLPVTIVFVGATWWAQRRWDIGLALSGDFNRLRIVVIGFALTVLGVTASLLQGYFSGMVRATELLEVEVDARFALTYALYMAVFAGLLAEVTFRGVIQSRMQTVLNVWPTVVTIAGINVLSHRWGPEITLNWFGLFVTLAGWTYLRWLSGSLWPPLIWHGLANLVMAIVLWARGPVIASEFSAAAVIALAVIGFASLALAAFLVRGMRPATA
jgi:membrane protease YdiL (CAAX protease family)